MSEPNIPPPMLKRHARYGLVLFAIYVALYVGFIVCSLSPHIVSSTALFGLNLAVVYGFGLILSAFLLALLYMVLCRR